MSKFYLDAYVSGNFGDDLLIYILCKRYPEHDFYMIMPYQFRHIYKNIGNLHPLFLASPGKYNIFLRLRKKIINYITNFKLYSIRIECKKMDYSILCGGSMFIQNTNWRERINEDKKIHELFKHNIIIGCNFGPYTSKDYYEKYKEEFNNCDFVSFRDCYSYNLFSELKNVEKGCDIAFQLKEVEVKKKNYVVVSVINCKRREELKRYYDDYQKFIIRIIEGLISNTEIVLCSLCETEGDVDSCYEIYNSLKSGHKDRVKIYNHDSILNTIKLFQCASGIIGTRFHSIMLGIKFNIPVVPVIYSDKTKNELIELEYKDKMYDIKCLQEYLLTDIQDQLKTKPSYSIEKIVSSENHFKYLDRVV